MTRKRPPTLTFRRWWISTLLARLRSDAGLTAEEAADMAGVSLTVVYRAESGENVPGPGNMRNLLKVYRADDEKTLELLLDLRRQPDDRGWWAQHADTLPGDLGMMLALEEHAAEMFDWEVGLIPGLLQTKAYATAVVRTLPAITPAEVRRRVDVRMQRQRVLTGDDPLRLHAIIGEGALLRPVGGPKVMREQLLALVDRDDLRVLPLSAREHPGMSGPFVVMRFRDKRAPMAVFLEDNGGQRFVTGVADLERFGLAWEAIAKAALSRKDSSRLIADAAQRFA